jgi:hypothetical protein
MNEELQNFDDLKRLLKLKRHETPPPGYFNNFSDSVVARLRDGEGQRKMTFLDRMDSEASWLASLLRAFETKPGAIGVAAAGLCTLLVVGVIFADYSDRPNKKLLDIADATAQAGNTPVASLSAPVATSLLASSDSGAGIMADTNAVNNLQSANMLFGQPAGAGLFQTASFAPGH